MEKTNEEVKLQKPFYAKNDMFQRLAYEMIVPFLENFSQADICFICDITKSMRRHIELIKNSLKESIQNIFNQTKNSPRIALIAFKDKNDPQQLYIQNFVYNYKEIVEFLDQLTCEGGGDACEDLVAPLKAACELDWRSDSRHVYLLLDAPSHGKSYHLDKYSDDYPDDDKYQMIEKIAIHYKKNRINLTILKCTSTVDIMLKKMRLNYESDINVLDIIDVPKSGKELKEDVARKFANEMSSSFTKSLYNNFRKYNAPHSKPTTLGTEAPIRISDEEFKGEIYSGSIKHLGFENRSYGYELDLTFTATSDFKITTKKIGMGTFSDCYSMQTEGAGQYVAKIPKKPAQNIEDLQSEIEGNVFASHIVLGFNKRLKISKAITVLPLAIIGIESKAAIFKSTKAILAQKCLKGDYFKFNNNYGWVRDIEKDRSELSKNAAERQKYEDIKNGFLLAQAYSHFTYEYSRGTLIIVDIQGTVKDGKLSITDPAIHSEFYAGKFGITNLGRLGIVRFFRTHICNDYCRQLYLIDPNTLGLEELEKLRAENENNKHLIKLKKIYEDNIKKLQADLKNIDDSAKVLLEGTIEERMYETDKVKAGETISRYVPD